MKYLYTICFSLVVLISNNTFGQKYKHDDFIKELEDFKFSLYPYLDTISYQDLSNNTISIHHPLSEYIKEFLQEHAIEISHYQKNVLEKYEKNVIEKSNYKKDTNFFKNESSDIWNADWNEKVNYFKEQKKHPMWDFMLINPIDHALLYQNFYLSHNSQPSEIGLRVMKDKIAKPKIKTENIDKNSWRIFIDYYSDLYEFEYDCKHGDIVLLMRYIRKTGQ